MPRVAEYDPGQVAGDGGMSGRVDVAAPQGAFGVDPSAVASVGQATDVAAKYLQAYQDQQDEARVMQISRPAAIQYRTALYGADDGSSPGYLALSGGEALNARQGVMDQLTKVNADTLAQAQNPRQRALLQKKLDSDFDTASQAVATHANTQGKVYADNETAAQASLEQDNFVSTFGFDPAAAAPHLQAAEAYTRQVAISKGGGPAAEEEAVQGLRTKAWGAVLDNQLADPTGGALKAQQTFSTVQGFMDPVTRAAYATKVHDAATTYAASAAADATASSGVAAGPSGAPVAGSVPAAIRAEAQAQGKVDPTTAVAVAMLENPSFNPKAKNPNASSYGMLQMTDATWKAMGGAPDNRDDPQTQIKLGVKYMGVVHDQLAQSLGRPPTASEIYLGYQQGPGGASALLNAAPGANAIATLTPVYAKEYGPVQGAALARQAVVNNGGSVNSTAQQFVAGWATKSAARVQSASSVTGAAVNPTSGAISTLPTDKASFVDHALAISGVSPADLSGIAKVRAAAESRYNDMHATADAANTQAWNNVQSVLRNPDVKTLDQAITAAGTNWTAMSETQKTSFYDHYKNGGQFAPADDPQAIDSLERLMVNDPTGFGKANLVPFASQVTQGTWQHYRQLQTAAQQGTGEFKDAHASSSAINATISALAPQYGYPRSPKPNSPEAQTLGAVRQTILDRAQTQAKANGKAPDPADLNSWANDLFTTQVKERTSGGVFGDATAYMSLGRHLGQRAPNGGVPQAFVPMTDIPKPRLDYMISSYVAAHGGRQPTQTQLENSYPDFVQRGVFDGR